ncbi:MAG: FGGY-family carbohydrate kinase, partial [Chitinophagaceae bacterium]
HLMLSIVKKQFASSGYVMTQDVKRIFVDGGFSKNLLYMNMLATFYPGKEVYAATIAQSTALGAALAIHGSWNDQSLPANMIDLKYYSSMQPISF